MSFDPRRLRSASELKAVSHPLRLEIIEKLSLNGPMTASELGDALGESPANCSWHLRKLAEYAFVEETHDGHGRRRPWRLVKLGLTFGDDSESEDSGAYFAASLALRESMLEREARRFLANKAADQRWGDLGMIENVILMTEDEARAFHADLLELAMRHHERLTGEEPRPPDARPVHVIGLTSVEPR